MAYTPINLHAFTAAYSGAVSGMAVSGWITNPSPSSYQLVTKIAGAFAQAFDQAWDNPVVNELDEFSILSAVQNEFATRGPGPLANPTFQDPASWSVPAMACVALVLEGDAYFLGQGITPPVWPPTGTPGQGILIFANIAALAAFDVTLLPQGTVAFVQSNGSFWGINFTGAFLFPDNITVVTANPAGQWVRLPIAGYLEFVLVQTSWFIDPQNSTTHASDENDGLTSTTPLLSCAEIYRRYGYTWSPNLGDTQFPGTVNVTLTFLSGPNGVIADPCLFTPNLSAGSTFTVTAPLPPSSLTTTLTGVVPKSSGVGPTALQAAVTSGAFLPNMMLVNHTRGNSRAFVQRNIAGATWQISQPLNPYAGPIATPDTSLAAEVDTWANGDSIDGYLLIDVDLPLVGGVYDEFPGFNHGYFVYQVSINDPGNTGAPCILHNEVGYLVVECSFGSAFSTGRSIAYTGTGSLSPLFYNVAGGVPNPGVSIDAGGIAIPQWAAGIFQGITAFAENITFLLDPILSSPALFLQGTITFTNNACIDGATGATTDVITTGNTSLGTSILYGGAGASFDSRALTTYTTSGTTQFNLGNGIRMNTATEAYSFATGGGGLVTVHRVPLTPANLDAAAGPAGFGGLAIHGTASFEQQGLSP